MKSERRHCAASALTGMTELIIWYFTGFDWLGGLGIGMLVYAFWYSQMYRTETGEHIWKTSK